MLSVAAQRSRPLHLVDVDAVEFYRAREIGAVLLDHRAGRPHDTGRSCSCNVAALNIHVAVRSKTVHVDQLELILLEPGYVR